MDAVQIGEVEISPWVLFGLSASEFLITFVKSMMFKKKRDWAGFMLFIIEALIGAALTAITSASLFNRVVAWKGYPIAVSVGLGLFELSVIITEALLIIILVSRDVEHRDQVDNVDFVQNCTTMVYYFFTLIVFVLIIIFKRRGLQKDGDRPVEIVTAASVFYSVFLPVAFPFLSDDGGDVPLLLFSGLAAFIFSWFPLLTYMIQMFRFNKYIDSAIITILLVLVPGSFSISMMGYQHGDLFDLDWSSSSRSDSESEQSIDSL